MPLMKEKWHASVGIWLGVVNLMFFAGAEDFVELDLMNPTTDARIYSGQLSFAIDDNTTTCFETESATGQMLRIQLETPAIVKAVKLFLARGRVCLSITAVHGNSRPFCNAYTKAYVEKPKWYFRNCSHGTLSSSVILRNICGDPVQLKICDLKVFTTGNFTQKSESRPTSFKFLIISSATAIGLMILLCIVIFLVVMLKKKSGPAVINGRENNDNSASANEYCEIDYAAIEAIGPVGPPKPPFPIPKPYGREMTHTKPYVQPRHNTVFDESSFSLCPHTMSKSSNACEKIKNSPLYNASL